MNRSRFGEALRCHLLALAALSSASSAVSPALAQSPSPVVLFPNQASVEEPAGASGLVRLPLGPEVLAGAAADLGDVRLFDAYGREVPYGVDRGERSYPAQARGRSEVVVAFDADERTELVRGVATSTETYRLRPPRPPGYGGTWELVFEPEPAELVRQVVVHAEPPFGGRREVTRTSIFRYARFGNERLAIPLPGVEDEPLTIVLSGAGFPTRPRFLLREIDRSVAPLPTVEAPLSIREIRREGTRSIVVVERPRGLRTTSLTLGSSTGSFVRTAVVRALPSNGGAVLGRGGLVRIAGLDVPELRTIALDEGGGDVLEIEIEDGDSPTLADIEVTATLRVPALLFDAGRARTMLWGGHRVRAPRYDLMALELGSRRSELEQARLGPIARNPVYDETPALAFAMRPGQVVSLAPYTHRAALTIPVSRDGLCRFAVRPELWAEAREDLADLRVIDAQNRQWPYVLASPGSEELEVSVAAPRVSEEATRRTIHAVTLPARALSPTLLRIELPPQLVTRSVAVRARDERGEEVELGAASFVSNEDAPARLEVPLFGDRVVALWLDIDNGDEAPLAIERVTLAQPAHEVQLLASAGEYRVVVGDLEGHAPAYDLDGARELIDALERGDAQLGALEANPEHQEPSFFEQSGWETIVLSAVLGLVVVVLFVLTLRIARSESGPAAVSAEASAMHPAPAGPAPAGPAPAPEAPAPEAPAPEAPETPAEPSPGPSGATTEEG
jgi:hypothetical protein